MQKTGSPSARIGRQRHVANWEKTIIFQRFNGIAHARRRDFHFETTVKVVFIFLKEEKYNYYLPKGAARGAGGGCQEGHPYTVYCFLGGQYQPEEVNLSL